MSCHLTGTQIQNWTHKQSYNASERNKSWRNVRQSPHDTHSLGSGHKDSQYQDKSFPGEGRQKGTMPDHLAIQSGLMSSNSWCILVHNRKGYLLGCNWSSPELRRAAHLQVLHPVYCLSLLLSLPSTIREEDYLNTYSHACTYMHR